MTTTMTMTGSVANAPSDARALFIRRTYAHLAGAVGAFVAIEYLLLDSPVAAFMLNIAFGTSFGWLGVLGAFMVCGWMARSLAASTASVPAQYAGLALYIVADAVIFLPLIYLALSLSDPTLLPTAGILTLGLFGGLTLIAFTTRTDYSFLRGVLTIGGVLALGLIVCSFLFGFELGLAFSAGMVALAGAAILYDTSKIIHSYNPAQHVAASLELFASVALLFWYILRILIGMRR